ncbi:MAG: DUF2993 domain-containing protein [Cyanobacteria bacterium J06632_3]
MEIITALLSGLLLLISPVGIVVDQVAEDAIRSRLAGAESLDVRIDNGPSYQLLQGKVDRVRIAGRGISPIEGLRFDVAELETDAIDLQFKGLRQGQVILEAPFQGAAHLVLTEEDVNAFVRSPFVQERLGEIAIGGVNPLEQRELARYDVANPTVDFLDNGRIRASVELEDLVMPENSVLLLAEVGVAVEQGTRLKLIEPTVSANGQPVPTRLINAVLGDLTERFSLEQLEPQGVTARVLNLATQEDLLDLALWVRVDPSVTLTDVTMPEVDTDASDVETDTSDVETDASDIETDTGVSE